jgi:hypothetical protein
LQQSSDFGQDNVQHTLLKKSQLRWLSLMKTTSEIKTKAAIFIPQSKTTMSEDTSPKSIKLKTTIQLLKAIFHLKINITVSTIKGHSKEVASIQEEEKDEEEEEHP